MKRKKKKRKNYISNPDQKFKSNREGKKKKKQKRKSTLFSDAGISKTDLPLSKPK